MHSLRVASKFAPWTEAFWLALAHDGVEDGWLPQACCRWPALDAITRREFEVYAQYIRRCGRHPVARAVKIADLNDNLRRCSPSLAVRYRRALVEIGAM